LAESGNSTVQEEAMRLRRKAGTKEFLSRHQDMVVLNPREYRGRWRDFFGNGRPIHVELGMGKGKFISEMSVRHPDTNFIGIDLHDELLRRACERAVMVRGESGAPNLCLALGNIEYLEEMFAPGEVERFYLNFSDPWPKKRHARRRLTHPRFMRKYIQILNDYGEIHLKTDSRSLFEFSLNTFADMGLRMRNISLDVHGGGTPEGYVFTEYETKFVQQGMNIYRCEVVVGKRALEEHIRRTELSLSDHVPDNQG
jgi:tRNA (guanine-N7-)-methyltransferase